MSESRERVLERVRRALEGRWTVQLPERPWRPEVEDDPIPRLVENLRAGGVEVEVFDDVSAAAAWLQDWAGQFATVATSPLLPAELQPDLPQAPPEEAELGVSLALAAVADTGSVVLSSREGRRLQLLPPVHLVFVDAGSVVHHLEEALSRFGRELPSALALHSGPSRSADIGQIMVQGVHGPGRLVVALVRGLKSAKGKRGRSRRAKSPSEGKRVGTARLEWESLRRLEGKTLSTKRGEPFEVVKVTENTVRVRVGSSGKEYNVRRSSLEKAAALLAAGQEISGPVAYRKLVANEAPAYAWSLLHELGLV
ncbi:LutC/YkgG family protein [Oceanithermus sp.]